MLFTKKNICFLIKQLRLRSLNEKCIFGDYLIRDESINNYFYFSNLIALHSSDVKNDINA